ncbi:hypothetical protein BMF94_0308 [Rhodotorula taiwanensis]|uniref:Uncharacterized protein n=1 Tax=Rhodotorula taiwanensis TaxID=741276 RepID=A0A2S5BIX0_9BASI|nr:hypothetical protein BMF94_0308 [Rhodotorula taiwanensis]
MALHAWPRIDDAFSSLDEFVLECFRYAATTGVDLRALVRQPERAYLGCGLPPASGSKRTASKTCCFRLTARPRGGDGVRVTAANLEHDCSPAKRSEARRSGEAQAKMLNRAQKPEDEMDELKDPLDEQQACRPDDPPDEELDFTQPASHDVPWPPKRFSTLEAFQTSCEAYARHHNFWLFDDRIPKTGEYRYRCSQGRDRPGGAP